jgi:glycosyltransferase involved in cell wall biosynthesis
MKPLCITLTSPFVLNAFLLGHISQLIQVMRVTVCVNTKESDISISLPGNAELVSVEIRRAIAPVRDFRACWKLWRIYVKRRFGAVFTVTPKGGLLGMVAALAAGVPVRVHCFTGQVWANKRGIGRALLKSFDRIISFCATHLLADSPSQRDFLVAEGIVGADRIQVLGHGSISGVNVKRFRPNHEIRRQIRSDLGIGPGSTTLLYAGRMRREKGVLDLIAAYSSLLADYPSIRLILVGPDEENLLPACDLPGLHAVGYSKHVENYMAAADIFCLPSYREGFGSVLIEAAATGLPSVASRIYGITDAVVDGVTGLLHSPGDVSGIKQCLVRLLENPSLARAMGESGRLRATDEFASAKVEGHLRQFLCDCMNTGNSVTKHKFVT